MIIELVVRKEVAKMVPKSLEAGYTEFSFAEFLKEKLKKCMAFLMNSYGNKKES